MHFFVWISFLSCWYLALATSPAIQKSSVHPTRMSPVLTLWESSKVGKSISQKTVLCDWYWFSNSYEERPQILGKIKIWVIVQVKSQSLERSRDRGQNPSVKMMPFCQERKCMCLCVLGSGNNKWPIKTPVSWFGIHLLSIVLMGSQGSRQKKWVKSYTRAKKYLQTPHIQPKLHGNTLQDKALW